MAGRTRLATLKNRAEFGRVRGGRKWGSDAFLLEAKARIAPTGPAGSSTAPKGPRFGFTVTKKIGGAVERNRIRRRLKEAVRAVPAGHAKDGFDYVLVARRAALEIDFRKLQHDLETALAKVHAGSDKSGGSGDRGPRAGGGETGRRRPDRGEAGGR
jgi:ribonuclease P protein component